MSQVSSNHPQESGKTAVSTLLNSGMILRNSEQDFRALRHRFIP